MRADRGCCAAPSARSSIRIPAGCSAARSRRWRCAWSAANRNARDRRANSCADHPQVAKVHYLAFPAAKARRHGGLRGAMQRRRLDLLLRHQGRRGGGVRVSSTRCRSSSSRSASAAPSRWPAIRPRRPIPASRRRCATASASATRRSASRSASSTPTISSPTWRRRSRRWIERNHLSPQSGERPVSSAKAERVRGLVRTPAPAPHPNPLPASGERERVGARLRALAGAMPVPHTGGMAAPASPESYKEIILFLATAGVVVPLFLRLKISPVLGFLGAGAVLGPLGLGRFVGRCRGCPGSRSATPGDRAPRRVRRRVPAVHDRHRAVLGAPEDDAPAGLRPRRRCRSSPARAVGLAAIAFLSAGRRRPWSLGAGLALSSTAIVIAGAGGAEARSPRRPAARASPCCSSRISPSCRCLFTVGVLGTGPTDRLDATGLVRAASAGRAHHRRHRRGRPFPAAPAVPPGARRPEKPELFMAATPARRHRHRGCRPQRPACPWRSAPSSPACSWPRPSIAAPSRRPSTRSRASCSACSSSPSAWASTGVIGRNPCRSWLRSSS